MAVGCSFAKSQNCLSSSAKRVRLRRFFKGKDQRQQAGCLLKRNWATGLFPFRGVHA
jgi:hypothetical protein